MKIDKHVPMPEPLDECKTAFVKDMKVGDSVLIKSGGYSGKEARRVLSAMRHNGFASTSRTESGEGKNATIRIWRIAGSRQKWAAPKKVRKHTQAGKRGKIIQCPECSHRMVMSGFAWSKLVCLGCKAEIKKTDYLLPKLSPRQEAKVRKEPDWSGRLPEAETKDLAATTFESAQDCRARQYSVLQTQHFLRGGNAEDTDKFQIAFDALCAFLHKSRIAVYLGELSEEEVKQLNNDTGFWNSLRDKFSDQEANAICKGKKDDD